MQDYLVRALGFEGQVRAFAVKTTETVSEAQRRHNTWPVVSAALGRSITASVMMGAMLKGEDKLTVKIEGNGPIGPMIIDANAKGEVRGYASNPHVHFDLNEQGKKQYIVFCEKHNLHYYPSQTNFVLFEVKADSQVVFEEMMKRGFITRSGSALGVPGYLRVTIGTEAQNEKFLALLEEVLVEQGVLV